MKKLQLNILLLVLVLVFGCATTSRVQAQDISYKKGRHVKDKVEVRELVRTEYKIDLLKFSKKYCYFRIKKIEFREKLVTPLYQEIQVTKTKVYDPSGGEMLADIIGIPFIPMRVFIGGDAAGTHINFDKRPTGRLLEGKMRVDGVVRGSPGYVSDALISLRMNGNRVKGSLVLENGLLKIPSKIIADRYLMDSKVDIEIKGTDFKFGTALNKDFLEKVLRVVYGLD